MTDNRRTEKYEEFSVAQQTLILRQRYSFMLLDQVSESG
jgi:hypothetical protein